MNPQEKEINEILKDLLQKGHQLKKGTSVSAAGPGADVVVKIDSSKSQQTFRAKAANKIESGMEVLVVFSPSDKILIALNPYPPIPGNPKNIEKKESRRPPKPTDKKESAIVPILVSKTVGEALEERPECTCTHYAIGKITGSRPFSYETCDGTVPGAGKDRGGVEQKGGIYKVYYWCFNSWNTNSSIPWMINGIPSCEEPRIPLNPDIDIYGSRSQDFKLNPFQPNNAPRTPLYSASNMYLLDPGPINAYFTEPIDPLTAELFLYPQVQDAMWGFHLVADEQAVITSTGKKYAIKPTTITEVPTLTPPVTAIANAKAWYHSSGAFGGIVRGISSVPLNDNSGGSEELPDDVEDASSNSVFNFEGYFVAFGEPIDCWYDDNDNPVADGMGTKREIGVVLRSFGYWNRVPWQLAVDPDVCPTDPTIEKMLNEPPKDPEDPDKYLMTKWFVGGVTEQWLELPVTHRVDDPHYAMISCNSEKKKIWVSIKTGLDPLNTYEEKTEWFIDSDEILELDQTIRPAGGFAVNIEGKLLMGFEDVVENNYLYPSDLLMTYGSLSKNYLYSKQRAQFSNQGARFCKIQLVEIGISDEGILNVNNNSTYLYEESQSIPDNIDNWKHKEMISFLAYLNANKGGAENYNQGGLFGDGPRTGYYFMSEDSESVRDTIFTVGVDYSPEFTGEENQDFGEFFLLPTTREKINPYLAGLTSFFDLINHGVFPKINQKLKSDSYWNNYKYLKLGQQGKKELYGNAILGGINPIYTINILSTVRLLADPIMFMPIHILGIGQKDDLIKILSNDIGRNSPVFDAERVNEFRTNVFYRRKFGTINYIPSYQMDFYKVTDRSFLFWDKEKFNELFREEIILTLDQVIEEEEKAKEKKIAFFEKRGMENEYYAHESYFSYTALASNLDKNKLCCFDFVRGYRLDGKPEQGSPPSLFNELAFSSNPVECPVYVCEFDENDDLKDYNIYAGKVANALVYPFDYTEGEPCSFTVWGAAPALMKLKKS